MRFLPSQRVRLVALAAVATALMAGGIAYASIPDSSGAIHSCYTKSGGALRVIDSAVTNCKSTETSLNWNQTGPPGPPGANGNNGTNGTNGKDGATGPTGPSGPTGPAGMSVQQVTGNTATLGANSNISSQATCPTGTNVIGGGYTHTSFGTGTNVSPFAIVENGPAAPGKTNMQAWIVTAGVISNDTVNPTFTFTAVAYCAS